MCDRPWCSVGREENQQASEQLGEAEVEQARWERSIAELQAEAKGKSTAATSKLKEDKRTLAAKGCALAEQLESRRKLSEKYSAEIKQLKRTLLDTEHTLAKLRTSHAKLVRTQHSTKLKRIEAAASLEAAEKLLAAAVRRPRPAALLLLRIYRRCAVVLLAMPTAELIVVPTAMPTAVPSCRHLF